MTPMRPEDLNILDQPDMLDKLDKLVRKLAGSRWTRLAILRVRSRRQWLKEATDQLYARTQLERTASLPREDAEALRSKLAEMEGCLDPVRRSIPFDRRLPAVLRPFTQTFQQIILLFNAIQSGRASLSLRLEGAKPVDLPPLHLHAADILDARERMAAYAPGWADPEMDLYDHL